MKTKTLISLRLASPALFTLLLSAAPAARATQHTWDGGDTSKSGWATAGNWNPNGVPAFTNTTDILFNTAGAARLTNFLGTANRTVRSLTFNANADTPVSIYTDADGTNGTARNLIFSADAGISSISVDVGAGATALRIGPGTKGNVSLFSDLDITNNSPTAVLTIGRPVIESAAGRSIAKYGAGKLTLAGANTYSGSTTISAGTLALGSGGSIGFSPVITVNGTFDVSAVTGGFTLNGGQDLAGTGTVNGNVTLASSATATVHPGGALTAGTLTFGGNLTFGANAKAIFDCGSHAASGNDRVVLANASAVLTGGGASITINQLEGADTLEAASYLLFDLTGTSGTVAGPFNAKPEWLPSIPSNRVCYTIVTEGRQVLLKYTDPAGATNLPPTGIRLSNASVYENQPAGTAVGALSAADANLYDTHVFTLASGPGDADNGAFAISNGELRAAAAFDFEARDRFSVRVRATDPGGLFVEEPLTIAVDDLNEVDLASQVPPNIIVYMCDDMGIGEVSAYQGKKLGPNAEPVDPVLNTPNFERLADAGLLFTDVHTGSSMCSPTRYALLTGRYAWRSYNKHTVIGGWNSRPLIAPGRPTLATLLRQKGYRTAAFGKWHLGWTLITTDGQPAYHGSATEANWATIRAGTNPDGSYVDNILDGPCAHGFDYFYGVSQNFANDYADAIKAFIRNNAIQGIATWKGSPTQGTLAPNGPGVPDWNQQRMGERYMNESLGYIDDHVQQGRQEPFFFYYVPNANHGPTDPATNIVVQGRTIPIKGKSSYSDGRATTTRSDMIYENNIAVGLLLDKLAAVNDPRTGRPMINSTLFIFTSDNGPDASGVGQAGLRDKKTALYEGGHRVPFIAAWPDGGIPAGAVSRANFGQFDLYASFSALLSHPLGIDEAEDSANALPALLGQVPGTQFRRPHALVSHDDSLTSNDLPDDSALAIREQSALMMINGTLVNRNKTAGSGYGTATPIKLFDLDADLHQDSNLLGQPDYAALVSNLTERLILFHNRGHSRELNLSAFDALLLSDGGVDLRNNRSGAVGYEFTTGEQPLVITSLGLWDDGALDVTNQESAVQGDGQTAGAPDGVAVAHAVRLFDGVSQQPVASVAVEAANSYTVGEFRYVDLPEPIMLDTRKRYALTMSTASGDGDLFHHFAGFTAVSPAANGLAGEFVARIAAADGAYPDQYPDGADGEANRHPDMFRHRMFVGPNARLAPFRITSATYAGERFRLTFPAGADMTYRLEGSETLSPADWQPEQTGIAGSNGYVTVTVTSGAAGLQHFYRLVKEE